MKRYVFLIVSIVLILTGCTAKSSFSTIFDKFSFTFYDNNKTYINQPLDVSIVGMKVFAQMKETPGTGDTGFVNSLIIIKTIIPSWTDMKSLVDSNIKKLEIKLSKYTTTDTFKKQVKCDTIQYSWYITTFSYQLGSQTLYGGQYFFTDNELVYLISFNTDDKKDSKQFIKSIGTVKCVQ